MHHFLPLTSLHSSVNPSLPLFRLLSTSVRPVFFFFVLCCVTIKSLVCIYAVSHKSIHLSALICKHIALRLHILSTLLTSTSHVQHAFGVTHRIHFDKHTCTFLSAPLVVSQLFPSLLQHVVRNAVICPACVAQFCHVCNNEQVSFDHEGFFLVFFILI